LEEISPYFHRWEQICSFSVLAASWGNDFLLQSLYLQRHFLSGERTMQASEAFSGLMVAGVGLGGLLAALPPDKMLGFQYTTAFRLSPRNLLRAA
jgi:hypothetical protein